MVAKLSAKRLVRMLEDKAQLFDACARRGAVTEATPAAVDVSETEPARRMAEEEQGRPGLEVTAGQGDSRKRATSCVGAE